MIRDHLIPALREAFPALPFTPGLPPAPVAVFPAKHPKVGDVRVFDHGEEATVLVGEITHGHFNPYDESLSEQQVAERVAADVVEFLKALFSDQVLLYRSANRRIGGWQVLGEGTTPERCPKRQYFVWSGPVP